MLHHVHRSRSSVWRYASDNYLEGVAHTSPGQSPGKSIPDEFSPVRAGHHNTGLIMSQSLSKILLHIVFSTKNRIDLIPVDRMKDLHAYLAGACRAYHSEAFRVGGTGNHVHIACTLPRTQTVSKLLEEIKKSSSQWMKIQDFKCPKFAWQAGYGVFSLGQSQLESLIGYIDHQEEHHQKRTYKEELLELLHKYKIEYDEKYLWD